MKLRKAFAALGVASAITLVALGAGSASWGGPGDSWSASSPSTETLAQTDAAKRSSLHLAVISYWQPSDYAKLPSGSVALVNPANGIVGAPAARVDELKTAVHKAAARGVRILGYVPTGYGDRQSGHPNAGGSLGQTRAEIDAQIKEYAEVFASDLEGIFFDETSQDCTTVPDDYKAFSDMTHAAGLQWSAFNPGTYGPGYCFVDGTPRGDVIVTFEASLDTYLTNPYLPNELVEANTRAHKNGALTWHLINTAAGTSGLTQAIAKLRERAPDYAYVTDIGADWQHGDNTWGSPPTYWETLLKCLSASGCDEATASTTPLR